MKFQTKTVETLASRRVILLSTSLFTAALINAAGFEKNVLWSGKYQGRAGAATSSVKDSEALLFNPAGLADISKGDVHLNFSPTFSTFKGPVFTTNPAATSNTEETTGTEFSPVGGLTGAYRLNDDFVLAGGVFVSGGTNAIYDDFSAGGGTGKAESKLTLIDFALGTAYKITNEWSVGLSWKTTYATAALASVTGATGAINPTAQIEFTDLKVWDFAGFRLGTQYKTENYGVGLNVRTPVHLKLKGKGSVHALAAPAVNGSDDDVSISSEFPMQVAFGGHAKVSSSVTAFVDASWTNYGRCDRLDIEDFSVSGALAALATGANAADIPLKWMDQQVVRLGAEWAAFQNVVLRGGYALTSQVTPEAFARATFASPGLGHTFTLGAGTSFFGFDTDLAVDYSFASGKVDATTGGGSVAGKYSSHSYTAHIGIAKNF